MLWLSHCHLLRVWVWFVETCSVLSEFLGNDIFDILWLWITPWNHLCMTQVDVWLQTVDGVVSVFMDAHQQLTAVKRPKESESAKAGNCVAEIVLGRELQLAARHLLPYQTSFWIQLQQKLPEKWQSLCEPRIIWWNGFNERSKRMIGHSIRDLHSFPAAEKISFRLPTRKSCLMHNSLAQRLSYFIPEFWDVVDWVHACDWNFISIGALFSMKQVCSYRFDCRGCKGVNKT